MRRAVRSVQPESAPWLRAACHDVAALHAALAALPCGARDSSLQPLEDVYAQLARQWREGSTGAEDDATPSGSDDGGDAGMHGREGVAGGAGSHASSETALGEAVPREGGAARAGSRVDGASSQHDRAQDSASTASETNAQIRAGGVCQMDLTNNTPASVAAGSNVEQLPGHASMAKDAIATLVDALVTEIAREEMPQKAS